METGETAAKPSPSSSSRYVKTVVLRDWWLVRSQIECEGKNLAVSGLPDEELALRVFISSPVAKRHSAVTLETADGVYVILKGFINRPRTEEGGFSSKVFKYFLFGFPLNWEEYAGRKLADDECPCLVSSVSSPRRSVVLCCAATVVAAKSSENSPAGEEIDFVKAASTGKKSKRASNSTKGNVGATSAVKEMKTKLKAVENVSAAEAINIFKATSSKEKSKNVITSTKSNAGAISVVDMNFFLKTSGNVPAEEEIDIVKAAPTAKKSRSTSYSTTSNVGATSGVKDMKMKLNTSENVPAGEKIDVVKAAPTTKKSRSVRNSTQSNVGATSGVKDMQTKLKASDNVTAGKAIDVVIATSTAKKSEGVSSSTKNNAGATSGVKYRKRKLTFGAEANLFVQESLKSPSESDIPSEVSGLKKSRSGRLLLHPLEFWRNQKAVYDSSRQITGIVGGTPYSGKGLCITRFAYKFLDDLLFRCSSK